MFPSSRYFLGAFLRAWIIFSGQNSLFSLANVKTVALRFLQKKREILYESTLIDFLLSCNQAVTCLNYKSGTLQRSARYFRDEFHTRISPREFPCFQAKWIAFEIKKRCSSYKANRAWEILIAFFPQTHRRISAFSMSAREKKNSLDVSQCASPPSGISRVCFPSVAEPWRWGARPRGNYTIFLARGFNKAHA